MEEGEEEGSQGNGELNAVDGGGNILVTFCSVIYRLTAL